MVMKKIISEAVLAQALCIPKTGINLGHLYLWQSVLIPKLHFKTTKLNNSTVISATALFLDPQSPDQASALLSS